MTSEAQARSNQANALHSTGPRTEEGKQRSSQNALKHGLTGRFLLLPHENRDAYEAHYAGYFNRYQPVDLAEINLVEAIAQDHWRVARARADESGIFCLGDSQHEDGSDTWLKHSTVLARIALYISRIERSIERNIKSLQSLQTERNNIETKQQELKSKQLEEAKLLTRLAWMQGRDYDPARDFPPETGFEFSAADLTELIEREILLDEARYYAANGWDATKQFETPARRFPKAA